MHFTRQSTMETVAACRSSSSGEGHHIWDSTGQAVLRRPLRPLRRATPATAASGSPRPPRSRPSELAFFPIWSYAHPAAIELADRLADYAPGDLNRVFFSTGGGEAVETAFKLAKYYWKLQGKPTKHKVISRVGRLPRHPAGRPRDHRHPRR